MSFFNARNPALIWFNGRARSDPAAYGMKPLRRACLLMCHATNENLQDLGFSFRY
jgi:hypothetical protein